MARDRLKELSFYEERPGTEGRPEPSGEVYIPVSPNVKGNSENDLFYNKIDEIQNEICTLVEHIHALEERHKSVLSSVGTEESSRSQARLSVLQNEVDALFSRARAGMMELRQLRTDGGQGVLQQKVLAQKLQEVAVRYRELQTTYRSSYVKRIERQVRIVNPDATEEEIESAVVFGNVFGQQLLSSQIASQRQILSDVQARQREIQQIDQSITELLTLFEEMQSMIDSQGEVVTNIETRVEKAAEDIVQSSSKLARAVEHRRSSRRMAWIICGIVTFVIIIILILLWFYVIKPIVDAAGKGGPASASYTVPSTTVASVGPKGKTITSTTTTSSSDAPVSANDAAQANAGGLRRVRRGEQEL